MFLLDEESQHDDLSVSAPVISPLYKFKSKTKFVNNDSEEDVFEAELKGTCILADVIVPAETVLATSLPIAIRKSLTTKPIIPVQDLSNEFVAPHILAAQTFKDEAELMFGEFPQSANRFSYVTEMSA